MKKIQIAMIGLLMAMAGGNSLADDYVIDSRGAHAFIEFKIKHLGYSLLAGRFNSFEGTFSYDPLKMGSSQVKVIISSASIDTNHSERDKHLRSEDFLSVATFPEARFVSTGFKSLGGGRGELQGEFTLRGVSKSISIKVNRIGEGKDPWGGYRLGFEGTAQLTLKDYGIGFDLGPAAETLELHIGIEGIRQ